jgi:hypothetical protein
MSTITYEAEERQEGTVSAFLMVVLEYATEIGLFTLLASRVHVPMKMVTYSLLHKAQTVLASIVMGCAHTKAINQTLSGEQTAAAYLGMRRFPDQSQINRYLTRFSLANVDELGAVHAQVLRQQSLARRTDGLLVVDIDQCGLVANGKTYEFHRKGYFPRKRGQEGYQVSLAYIGATDEAIQLYLDPGNVPSARRLPDMLHDVACLLGPEESTTRVVWRLDAGYDSPTTRAALVAHPGYVVLKGMQAERARRAAQHLPLQAWIPVADAVHGIELPPEEGLRRIVYELHQEDGTVAYALLYSTLAPVPWTIGRLYAFYNERTTIEAFFSTSRHVYNIQNLRSRQFSAIYAFLRFVVLTHNLLHWAKRARFAATDLVHATTRHLVSHIGRVRARVYRDTRWHVAIIRSSRWATLLIDALIPHPIQLELPFACLHKT